MNELEFTAYRYLIDDLLPSERAAFETRLGEDQQARESLATAVELSAAMTLASEPQSSSPFLPTPARRAVLPRLNASRQPAWITAVVTVAAVAAVVLLAFLPAGSPPGVERQLASLAVAWSEANESCDAGSAESGDDETADPIADTATRDGSVDWMVLAVADLAGVELSDETPTE